MSNEKSSSSYTAPISFTLAEDTGAGGRFVRASLLVAGVPVGATAVVASGWGMDRWLTEPLSAQQQAEVLQLLLREWLGITEIERTAYSEAGQ